MSLGCWWNTQYRRIHSHLSRRLFPRLRRQSHRASLNAACSRSYEDKTTDKVFDAAVVGRGGRAEGYKGKSDELLKFCTELRSMLHVCEVTQTIQRAEYDERYCTGLACLGACAWFETTTKGSKISKKCEFTTEEESETVQKETVPHGPNVRKR